MVERTALGALLEELQETLARVERLTAEYESDDDDEESASDD
jgi:hypothetical protein